MLMSHMILRYCTAAAVAATSPTRQHETQQYWCEVLDQSSNGLGDATKSTARVCGRLPLGLARLIARLQPATILLRLQKHQTHSPVGDQSLGRGIRPTHPPHGAAPDTPPPPLPAAALPAADAARCSWTGIFRHICMTNSSGDPETISNGTLNFDPNRKKAAGNPCNKGPDVLDAALILNTDHASSVCRAWVIFTCC